MAKLMDLRAVERLKKRIGDYERLLARRQAGSFEKKRERRAA